MTEFFIGAYRNIKLAAKTVFGSFSSYVAFFICIFVLQTAFSSVVFAVSSSSYLSAGFTEEEYDYHIIYKHLTPDMLDYLYDYEPEKFTKPFFEIKKEELENPAEQNEEKRLYSVYLRLLGDPEECERKFNSRVIPRMFLVADKDTLGVSRSPLYDLGSLADERAKQIAIASFVYLVASFGVLSLIYNIRINHNKFIYGIYMTFGADRKRLTETSVYELALISVITFAPSVLFGGLLSYLVCTRGGGDFHLGFEGIFFGLILSVVSSYFAVLIPMSLLSVSQPMRLIAAEDNSNLVASPRRSYIFSHSDFPFRYEALSIFRMRRYLLKLALFASVFCAVFVCGLYCSRLFSENLEYKKDTAAEFTLTFNSEEQRKEIRDEILDIDGIEKLYTNEANCYAEDVNCIVSFKNGMTRLTDGFYANTRTSGERIIFEFTLRVFDEDVLSELKDKYDILLSEDALKEDTVIIGTRLNNISAITPKLGDKITLYEFGGFVHPIEEGLTKDGVRRQKFKYGSFSLHGVTVAGIISDIPSDEGGMQIFVSRSLYQKLTKEYGDSRSADVVLERDLSQEKIDSIYKELAYLMDLNEAGVIQKNGVASSLKIEEKINIGAYITAISGLMLLFCPLIWFFSQILYYKKREQEFSVLRMIFAVKNEITKLYIQGGLLLSVVSAAISVPICFAGMYAFIWIYNYLIPTWTRSSVTRVAEFSVSPMWFLIVLAVSLASGFLSAFIPAVIYHKKSEKSDISDSLGREE